MHAHINDKPSQLKSHKEFIKPLALRVMESRLPENVTKGIKGESKQSRLKRAVDSVQEKESIWDVGEVMAASSSLLNVAKESCKNENKIDSDADTIDKVTETVQNIKIDPQPTKAKITPLTKNLSAPKPLSNKFEIPKAVRDTEKDPQGYFKVVVTHFDPRNSVYSTILASNKIAILANQMIMNTDYESNGIPFINLEGLKRYNSLIMALVNGNWLRCKVILGDEIHLKDIDSGKEYNLTLGNYPLKYPLERELIVHAFVYKIQFVNDSSGFAVGVELKIRLIDENYQGILKAELFAENPPIKKIRNESVLSETPRTMIEKVKVKNFPLGHQQLMILDGEIMSKGKIHVALAGDESQDFYDFLYDRILAYIEDNQDKNNYSPM
jgi:hypothetical protein